MLGKLINYFLLNWNIVRLLRLLLAIFAISAAVSQHDALMGIIGGIFMLQALFNVGCCGIANCSVTPQTEKMDKEIVFEEIKKQ